MNELHDEWAWLDEALENFDLNLDGLELDLDMTLPECCEIDFDCLPAFDLVLPEHLLDI